MGTVVPCPRCGAGQAAEPGDAGGVVTCWRCGASVPVAPAAPLVQPRVARRADESESDDFDEPRRPRRPRREPVSTAAVLSLVLGVVSCLLFCVWPVTRFTSVIGLACGAFGRNTPSRKMAVGGLVLSSVGLIFAVGFLVLTVTGVSLIDYKGGPKVPPPFFPVHP